MFVRNFNCFAHGRVVSDNKNADAGEIGRPGQTYRRISIESRFGKMKVLVTDGHLPFPFGHEITGYEVSDLAATLHKSKGGRGSVLSPPYTRMTEPARSLQFPGGYIAEVHALTLAKRGSE